MKSLVKAALWQLGYEIHRRKIDAPQVGMVASYLSRFGNPRTVFDVGVGFGTHELYAAFPASKFVLVEPLKDYEPTIAEICSKYDCFVEYAAAGERSGTGTIYVDPLALELTTFGEHTSITSRGRSMEPRQIRITTLDTIVAEHPELRPPFFLKIDTEGHELAVLRGATNLLAQTETVLAEVSIAPRFEGGYRFEDMIEFMQDAGFELMSIVNIGHATNELRPRFADLAFQRRVA
jgi:FkbM family methyltransferase